MATFKSSSGEHLTRGKGTANETFVAIEVLMGHYLADLNEEMINIAKSMGLRSMPFKLDYDVSFGKIGSSKPKQTAVSARQINLTWVDTAFYQKWVESKISWSQWLYKRDPKFASEAFKIERPKEGMSSAPRNTIKYERYRREYQREAGFLTKIKDPTKRKAMGKITIANIKKADSHVGKWAIKNNKKFSDKAASTDEKILLQPAFTKEEVEKFIDNEGVMWGSNIQRYATGQATAKDQKLVIEFIQKAINMFYDNLSRFGIPDELTGLTIEETYGHRKMFRSGRRGKEWAEGKNRNNELQTKGWGRYHENLTSGLSNRKKGFPNIENIRDWYVSEGIYQTRKLDMKTNNEEFFKLRSVKEKSNFIDRMVFLIANGVYVKKMGKPNSKGKKATIAHARRYKRPKSAIKTRGKRAKKLQGFREDNRSIARGLTKDKMDKRRGKRDDNINERYAYRRTLDRRRRRKT